MSVDGHRVGGVRRAGAGPLDITDHADLTLEQMHPDMVRHVERPLGREERTALKRRNRAAMAAALDAAWGERPATDVPVAQPYPLDDEIWWLREEAARSSPDQARRILAYADEIATTTAVPLARLVESAMRPVLREVERTARALARAQRLGDPFGNLQVKLNAQRARVAPIRAELRPLVQAVVDGQAPPWRVKGTRIIDDKGRDWWPAPLAPFRYGRNGL